MRNLERVIIDIRPAELCISQGRLNEGIKGRLLVLVLLVLLGGLPLVPQAALPILLPLCLVLLTRRWRGRFPDPRQTRGPANDGAVPSAATDPANGGREIGPVVEGRGGHPPNGVPSHVGGGNGGPQGGAEFLRVIPVLEEPAVHQKRGKGREKRERERKEKS